MRVLSGIQPSGTIHVGNYLGAIRNWVATQHPDAFYTVVDLHALTQPIEPAELNQRTFETAASLLAAGLDPQRCTLFIQSQVPFHTQLTWLLECVVSFGELRRMTQFKEKADKQEAHRAGLFTYPVLMASDILLYDTNKVPIGDDQRQHLELTREIAERFNNRYGVTFVMPEADIPTAGARVMDLQEPTRKMSKSVSSPAGTIGVFDTPEEITRKIMRAVTDNDGDVRFDPEAKPGLSNLIDIFAAVAGESPHAIAERYSRYGDLKKDLAEALVAALVPINERYQGYVADRAETMRQLAVGAERASAVAEATYRRAADAIGLLRQ
jgi:tryptophanyl-tRNA synthetase